ncbi:hypothetical protein D915_009844 [Fasciola hepatica]|uniref:Uncharacterized protein n=1 Tax=Fasciola hepatica TaxID=6192 RepID=A0A4E0RRU0_FASHE|nr:hypothetical protein D915_009844 [Fasciola hepatica]
MYTSKVHLSSVNYRSMNGMDLYAGEARNANRLKSFFDVNIQEQLLLITDIGIQLRVIKNPHEYTCPLLGSISHVVKLQTGLLNLLSSVVVFSASKIHNLNILMIKIYASCYLFLVCLATTFYFTIPKHYYTMNCLPRIIVPSLVYPMLITHSVAGVFLILYWTRPPYRNLDEWIGICGNTIFSLALWSSLVTMRKPNTFVSRGVIRLTVLTLFKGIYLAVYHVFLKCSMYGFYWRSLKGSKPGDKIQTPTTANTSTSSINKATSRKQRKLTTSTSSPMLTDSHEGSSISTTEIKSRSR